LRPGRALAHQPLDAARDEEIAETFQIVITKLIHDDEQDKSRLR